MKIRTVQPIYRYVATVSVAGLVAGAWIVAHDARAEIATATPAVAVLMLLVIVGELYPIRVPLRDDAEDVTTSTAFMFATLLLAGPALALIAQCTASVLSDVRARKPWWKATFNIGQYALSIAGAWIAIVAIAPDLRFGTAAGFANHFSTHDFIATL